MGGVLSTTLFFLSEQISSLRKQLPHPEAHCHSQQQQDTSARSQKGGCGHSALPTPEVWIPRLPGHGPCCSSQPHQRKRSPEPWAPLAIGFCTHSSPRAEPRLDRTHRLSKHQATSCLPSAQNLSVLSGAGRRMCSLGHQASFSN